jgi:SAM-dependent methyltransferase
MHPAAWQFLVGEVTRLRLPPRVVIDLGGRDVNGSPRALFPAASVYTAVDLLPGAGVDIVADAATWQPAPPPAPPALLAALVLCCEVAEHTPVAPAIVRNAYRLLSPGGVFLFTAAGVERQPHSALDGGPLRPEEYYAPVSTGVLADWLAPFTAIQISTNPDAGDVYAIARKTA